MSLYHTYISFYQRSIWFFMIVYREPKRGRKGMINIHLFQDDANILLKIFQILRCEYNMKS